MRLQSGGARLLIALVMALASLFTWFSHTAYNPVTEEKQHVGMTVKQEAALGLQAAPQMVARYGGESERAPQLVNDVGQRVVSRSRAHTTEYHFDFHELADPETINAFALPGGQVFITDGLLRRLKTRGQLAGVLGHEVGHVVARHGAEHLARAQLSQGLTGAAVIATYDPDNPRSRNNAQVALLMGEMLDLRYGRNDELEADQLGVRFMAEAGYDPRAMIGVMKILAQASSGRTPEFFSTHPNPEHRVERIEEAIHKLYPNGVPDGLEP